MKLTGYEAQAFRSWDECAADFSVISFKTVSQRSGLDITKVRRAVRGLARKGLVVFFRTSWDDEGVPHGAGYGLTKEGENLRDQLAKPIACEKREIDHVEQAGAA